MRAAIFRNGEIVVDQLPEPKPGHEAIKGRYGFYAGSRGATKQD